MVCIDKIFKCVYRLIDSGNGLRFKLNAKKIFQYFNTIYKNIKINIEKKKFAKIQLCNYNKCQHT